MSEDEPDWTEFDIVIANMAEPDMPAPDGAVVTYRAYVARLIVEGMRAHGHDIPAERRILLAVTEALRDPDLLKAALAAVDLAQAAMTEALGVTVPKRGVLEQMH